MAQEILARFSEDDDERRGPKRGSRKNYGSANVVPDSPGIGPTKVAYVHRRIFKSAGGDQGSALTTAIWFPTQTITSAHEDSAFPDPEPAAPVPVDGLAGCPLVGPDDSGTRGALIPSTSVEQYAATLAKWLGVADGDLPTIFSNLCGNLNLFGTPTLNFMG
jgi:hypothetical protein